MTKVTTTAGTAEQTVGRYVLDDLVAESAGSRMWRATDPVLHRPVGVRLLSTSDGRSDALREAACLASLVTDAHVVRVLDVLDTDDCVAVVTEWIPGRPLSEVLADGLSPLEATRIAREVADCLESAHHAGIAHGRIRPNSVLLSDTGDVRVRGLGVDAVLWGCAPDDDPVESDIHGVGAVLYAGLTSRWPYDTADGVASVQRANGLVPWPGRVAAEIPGVLDDVAARTVKDSVPRRDLAPFADMAAASQELHATVAALRGDSRATREEAPPSTRRGAGTWLRRLVGVIAGVLGVVGLGFLGWTLVTGGPKPVTPRTQALSSASTAPSKAALPSTAAEKALPILSARDYDPLGNGTENADLVALAIDRDPKSAWETVRYRSDYLSGKPGVGILLDLGTPRPIDAVALGFVGRGTDVSVRLSDTVPDTPEAWTPFEEAVGVPEQITLRSPKPKVARFVLVWLTRLPALPDGSFQGGIASVKVLG